MKTIPNSPIQAIQPDPRREGVVRLVVDGRPVLTAPLDAVKREGLAVGARIEAVQVERLLEASDLEAAYRTAIRALERRPFAARELERRLVLKGHPPALAREAVERAAAAGYVDDARFAQFYVQSRLARGRGPNRLRQELARAGVAKEVAEAAIREAVDPDTTAEVVAALVARRVAQLKGVSAPDQRRRLLAYLARRGYQGPEVSKIVRGAVL